MTAIDKTQMVLNHDNSIIANNGQQPLHAIKLLSIENHLRFASTCNISSATFKEVHSSDYRLISH